MIESRIRVFVVKDAASLMAGLDDRLNQLGYITSGTFRCPEFDVDRLLATKPDIVLMGLSASCGGAGLEAAKALRRHTGIPILFLADRGVERLVKQGTALSSTGSLIMPYDDSALHASIQVGVCRRRMELAAGSGGPDAEQRFATLADEGVFYRNLLENLPVRLVLKSVEGIFQIVSRQLAGDFGKSPDEMMGKTDFDCFPREIAERYQELDRRVITGGRILEAEEEYRAGEVSGAVQAIRAPVRDSGGRVTGVLDVFRDIVAQKRLEFQLKANLEAERALGRIAADFLRAPGSDVSATATRVLGEIGRLLRLRHGYVLLHGWAEANLRRVHSWTESTAEGGPAPVESVHPLEIPWIFSTLTRDGIVQIPDTYGTEAPTGADREFLHRNGIGAVVWVALRMDGQVIGVAGFDSAGPREALTEGEVNFLISAAEMIAIVFSRLQTESALRDINRGLAERVREKTSELASRNRIFASLSESAPFAIFQSNTDGGIVFVNRRWEEITGLTENESKDDVWLDAVHPEDRERVRTAWRQAVANQTPFRNEFRFCGEDAPCRWVIAQAVVYDDDGGYAGYLGTLTDISERKSVELALEQSQRRYYELIENTHDGVIQDDETGRVTYANRAFRKWFGLGELELPAISIKDYVAPEFQELLSDRHRRRMAGETAPDHFEYEAILPDGSRHWMDVEVTTLWRGGVISGTQSAIRDVTERKQREAERETLMESIQQSGEAVLMMDQAYRIEYVNPAFERITGYLRKDVTGKRPDFLLDGSGPTIYERPCFTALNSAERWQGRMDCRTSQGATRVCEVTISPLRDGAGRVFKFVQVMRDVTERLALETNLAQVSKMESIGRLAGGIAHDFNNLLTIINGYSGLLLNQLSAGDPNFTKMNEINRAGERAARLTKQLLAFSRRQVMRPAVVDINDVLTDMESMLSRLVGDHVRFSLQLSPLPAIVRVDIHQMEQVVMNLVINARDAVAEGGEILVRTWMEESADGGGAGKPVKHVLLEVADTGTGMAAATVERIFEPFFTTKEVGVGTGLGLATVQGIVAQSGGRIEVRSAPGKGSAFRVYLPVSPRSPSSAPEGGADRAAHGTETILVVGNQKEVRDFAVAALEFYGYRVLAADNASVAMRHFEEEGRAIELVATDIAMPEMNGQEFASQVTARNPHIRILIMSGYSPLSVPPGGDAPSMYAFIQKPFSPRQLAEAVRRLLGAGS